jgi:hypothetical protein
VFFAHVRRALRAAGITHHPSEKIDMKPMRTALIGGLLSLTVTASLRGQELGEVCPGAEAGSGALWGLLSDTDAEMALPGAKVIATWSVAGTPGRSEVQTAIDGSFTMCYVPLETELTVRGMIGGLAGQPVSITLTDPITRHDVGVSLTGATSAGPAAADKLMACVGPVDSQIRTQLTSLLRCETQWPGLEKCPRQELGRVSATASGDRGAMREMVERLIQEAERLGANALVNVDGGRGTMNALAVKIDVDPSTC